MAGPQGPRKNPIKEFHNGSDHGGSQIRYLAIGRVVRAHGIKGEVSMAILTDFPERFEVTEWVYLGNEFEATPYRLESYRWHKRNLLLTLAGVTSRTQAEQLRSQFVQVPIEEAVPLPEGSYYFYQLLGLTVVTTSGERLGTLTDILETGANDVLVIEADDQQILLPDIPDVVKSIDLESGQIVVQLMEGLI